MSKDREQQPEQPDPHTTDAHATDVLATAGDIMDKIDKSRAYVIVVPIIILAVYLMLRSERKEISKVCSSILSPEFIMENTDSVLKTMKIENLADITPEIIEKKCGFSHAEFEKTVRSLARDGNHIAKHLLPKFTKKP